MGITIHLNYYCNTKYAERIDVGASTWNNYKGGVIRKNTTYNSGVNTYCIDTAAEDGNTLAVTYPYGIIEFYVKNMDKQSEAMQYNAAIHELGHALGLDHNIVKSDIMYKEASETKILSPNDKASYDAAYNYQKVRYGFDY